MNSISLININATAKNLKDGIIERFNDFKLYTKYVFPHALSSMTCYTISEQILLQEPCTKITFIASRIFFVCYALFFAKTVFNVMYIASLSDPSVDPSLNPKKIIKIDKDQLDFLNKKISMLEQELAQKK